MCLGSQKTGKQEIFKEIITEIFPNLRKCIYSRIHEAHCTPSKVNLKKITRTFVIMKMTKGSDKQKILKAAGRKGPITYRER